MSRLACETRVPKPSVALIKRRREETLSSGVPPPRPYEPPHNFLGHLHRHLHGWTEVDISQYGGWTEDGLAAFFYSSRLADFVLETQGTLYPLVKSSTTPELRVKSFVSRSPSSSASVRNDTHVRGSDLTPLSGATVPFVLPHFLHHSKALIRKQNNQNWSLQRPRIADRHDIASLNHMSRTNSEAVIFLIHNDGLLSRHNTLRELEGAKCRVPSSKSKRAEAARELASFALEGVVFKGAEEARKEKRWDRRVGD